MTDPAEGIKDLLVAAGVGVFGASSGWGIFIAKEPEKPDSAVTIFTTGGPPPDPRYLLNYPSFQVRVRGNVNGYQEARTKIDACTDVLWGLPSQVINGDQWDGVTPIGDIVGLGYDSHNRPLMSFSFSLILEPATGTNRISL